MKDRPHPLEREVRNPILERAERMIEATGDPAIKDVGLISAMQHIEHQMIAGYGCARTYADLMGDENSAELLQESLNDERLTDESLTELSTRLIYAEAVMA
jgi:ferritin-like metal-binding protein YciE